LDQALARRVVTDLELRVPALASTDLVGATVVGVLARGKHLLIRLDDPRSGEQLTLHNHLRMDGSWRIGRAGQRPGGHPDHMIRALVGNADWLCVGFRVHDLRLIRTGDEEDLVGHLGPDILGPDWDPARAAENLAADPERAIGEALLDQRLLAGVGNMYKAEILFVEGVSPWSPAGRCDLEAVVRTSFRLLRMNRDHPEQSTTGSTARGREHWVYRRAGEPCRRCGAAIRRAEQGPPPRQRTAYWCPRCQSPP
jgi:endonuclease-8